MYEENNHEDIDMAVINQETWDLGLNNLVDMRKSEKSNKVRMRFLAYEYYFHSRYGHTSLQAQNVYR